MIVKTAKDANNIPVKDKTMLKRKERKNLIFHWCIFCVLASIYLFTFAAAKENSFICFDTEDAGQPDTQVPVIQPWKIVRLDPDFGGQWVLAADLNEDGVVDIISSENFNKDRKSKIY